MAGSNLPPGVTPADIDREFGGPQYRVAKCEAELSVLVTDDVDPTGLVDVTGEVVHVRDVEENEEGFVKTVFVDFDVKTQFRDTSDVLSDARDEFSVEAVDDRVVSVERVDTEVRA